MQNDFDSSSCLSKPSRLTTTTIIKQKQKSVQSFRRAFHIRIYNLQYCVIFWNRSFAVFVIIIICYFFVHVVLLISFVLVTADKVLSVWFQNRFIFYLLRIFLARGQSLSFQLNGTRGWMMNRKLSFFASVLTQVLMMINRWLWNKQQQIKWLRNKFSMYKYCN